jgi:thioredoxin 1
MQTVNESNFNSVIGDGNNMVLVDFWAEWCMPCRMLSPIIEECSKEIPNVSMYKCNVDESPTIADRFNIQSIPTLILFKGGQILDKKIGGSSKADIKKWITSNIC